MEEVYEDEYIDEVGGMHGGGVGWNPLGTYCGECNRSTCKDCEYVNLVRGE
jgi:hypothetical protein